MTTCVRCGRCSCRATDVPAHRLSTGEICQFDLWEPARRSRRPRSDPQGVGRGRVPGLSRAGAGAVIFTKQTPDLLSGIRRCLWSLGALPKTLVWDRQSGLHAPGRPTDEFAASAGSSGRLVLLRAEGSPGQGRRRAMQDFLERSFEPGRCFANELDFQLQLDDWFETGRTRDGKDAALSPCRSPGRGARGDGAPAAAAPDVDRRWVLRVPPDPYLRFDTCDYSLDPILVGRRVEARVTEREVLAVALDSGEVACRPSGASRDTARSPISSTPARCAGPRSPDLEPTVEIRSLARYDELIA